MQTKDHLALGRYLARVFEIEEPVKKYAFVIGNIMPDVNKCSYIHGYFQLLRAHRQQKDAVYEKLGVSAGGTVLACFAASLVLPYLFCRFAGRLHLRPLLRRLGLPG